MADDQNTDLRARLARCEAELQALRAYQERLEQRYRRSLRLIGDYAFVYNLLPGGELKFIWASDTLESFSGYSLAELNARGGWLAVVHPADQPTVRAALRRLRRGLPVEFEMRLLRADGTQRWLRIAAEAAEMVKNGERQLYGAARDIALEKRLQDEQARFITNAMHELSHPVSSILLRLHLMQRQPERLSEHLDALQPVAERIRRMIDDLRDLFYLQRGIIALDRAPVALQDVARRALERCRADPSCAARFDSAMTRVPAVVYADAERLAQALYNLLSKAAAVMPQGDRVRVEVLRPEGLDQALMRILFRGMRVDLEHPTLLFHPFHQPSEGSRTHTGLELAIAREIVRRHGGELVAAAAPEGRTAFVLQLPLWSESHAGRQNHSYEGK
ncbi:MAG: PAS domain-containing sensor histidine kinase [Aggregatilineales bacterium]